MREETEVTTETVQRADGLLAAEVGDDLLMMSVELGRYFNLNPVGARIWELLEQPRTLNQLVDTLTREYEVVADDARREVDAFLEALRERGLLKTGDGAAA